MTTRRPEADQHDDAQTEVDPHILTVNEAAEAYPGEWIFMKVMKVGERNEPLAGIVLAHHRTQAGINPVVMDVIRNPPMHAPGFYTYNGLRFTNRADVEDYLARKQAARGERA